MRKQKAMSIVPTDMIATLERYWAHTANSVNADAVWSYEAVQSSFSSVAGYETPMKTKANYLLRVIPTLAYPYSSINFGGHWGSSCWVLCALSLCQFRAQGDSWENAGDSWGIVCYLCLSISGLREPLGDSWAPAVRYRMFCLSINVEPQGTLEGLLRTPGLQLSGIVLFFGLYYFCHVLSVKLRNCIDGMMKCVRCIM